MARGRIPNDIMQQAQEDFNEYGFAMAWHYACYDISWMTGPTKDEQRYLRALEILKKQSEKAQRSN